MMSQNIVTLTSANFETEIKKPESPILVDFWAEWCGPCRLVAPVLETLSGEYDGRLRIGKVNVDEQSGLATKFGVQSIPTLLIFKGGNVVEQFIGAAPRDVLARLIEKHV